MYIYIYMHITYLLIDVGSQANAKSAFLRDHSNVYPSGPLNCPRPSQLARCRSDHRDPTSAPHGLRQTWDIRWLKAL